MSRKEEGGNSGRLPIESAPRDGTEVLLWDGKFYWLAHWYDDGYFHTGWDGGLTDAYGDRNLIPDGAVTHWMPLPAPPVDAEPQP